MKVLEDEHERQLAADGLERLEHLPEHPLVCCADQAAVDGLELVVGEKPRHLCDPRRRLPREQWDERPPARLASESAECGQHGQVGLAGATVLDALAVRDQRCSRTSDPSDEALNDCRLAYPCIAGDEGEATCTGLSLRVQPLEPDQLALATGGFSPGSPERGDRDRPVEVQAHQLLMRVVVERDVLPQN